MIAAIIVSIAFPIIFLYLVRWLDLYASGSFKGVIICFAWGWVAFFIALQVNNPILAQFQLAGIAPVLFYTIVTPIVEEIAKSSILVYFVRRSDFTYFVDGAIYGFAVGTGFAVIENLFYLTGPGATDGLPVALSRAFSTSLMHGSASALVGISLGRLKFGRGWSRILSLLLGWAGAMALHSSFNNIVSRMEGAFALVLVVVIGLGGVALVAAFIFWGLSEERRWLRETLKLDVGVSRHESSMVQKMEDLDTLLAPITERFGAEKRKQVEAFLRLEAQMGLKSKARAMTNDAKLSNQLDDEIANLRQQMDQQRQQVGLHCMIYARVIIPLEAVSMYLQLESMQVKETMTENSLFRTLGNRIKPS